jgi:hypothetical protein
MGTWIKWNFQRKRYKWPVNIWRSVQLSWP